MSKFLQKNKLSPLKFIAHRLFLVSLLIANKSSDDIYYNNNTIAFLGGINLEEMNFLEKRICKKYGLFILGQF